jgi:hypothetical protein
MTLANHLAAAVGGAARAPGARESNARVSGRHLPIAVEAATGSLVRDVDGKVFVDLLTGAGRRVNQLDDTAAFSRFEIRTRRVAGSRQLRRLRRVQPAFSVDAGTGDLHGAPRPVYAPRRHRRPIRGRRRVVNT